MKKIALLLLVVILLTACQPAMPTETATGPVEALADSASDLVGVWWFPKGGLMLEFKDDGTLRVYSGSSRIGQVASGDFTFEAGKVTFIPGGACKDPAIYEAYVTSEDGDRVSIRLQVMGNDSCSDRAVLLTNPGKFYNP
jgi:hypothetical protein